eukprot:Pgem_evm1s6199
MRRYLTEAKRALDKYHREMENFHYEFEQSQEVEVIVEETKPKRRRLSVDVSSSKL